MFDDKDLFLTHQS